MTEAHERMIDEYKLQQERIDRVEFEQLWHKENYWKTPDLSGRKEECFFFWLASRRTLREKIKADPTIGKLEVIKDWPESPDFRKEGKMMTNEDLEKILNNCGGKSLFDRIKELEESSAYWKNAWNLELAHSQQAEKRIRKLEEGMKLGWELSIYAACIHWSDKETNTEEWLDALEGRIEKFQELYKGVKEGR